MYYLLHRTCLTLAAAVLKLSWRPLAVHGKFAMSQPIAISWSERVKILQMSRFGESTRHHGQLLPWASRIAHLRGACGAAALAASQKCDMATKLGRI